jgi:hypothetical protein
LIHANWHVRVSGLNALADLIKQGRLPSNSFYDLAAKIVAGTLEAEISNNIPLVLDLLEHPEEDVRVSAIRVTGP